MMENRKKIGILIIVIALIFLVIIAILYFNRKKSEEVILEPISIIATSTLPGSAADSETPTTTPSDRPLNRQEYDISKEPAHQLNDNDASKLATSFAERLGSFSNQSNYGNVTDLKIFMTEKMRDWADKYVAGLKAQDYSGEYYGITTKTLTTEVKKYNEKAGTSEILVLTERQEGRADSLSEPFRQNMTVKLVEKNGEWLVDSAYWEDK